MSSKNWGRIEEIFFAAADLPDTERSAYLARVCDGDIELRAEIDSLLQADVHGNSEIVAAVESELSELLDDHGSLAGTRMGPYRVLKEIGRGGMGSVYLGERADQHYRKLVAIKVIKRGMDSAEVLARFRHERQILANLEHPYIARLIDGGTTPDDRPFFVLEYVQGQPIDVHCRERQTGLEDRLRLFLRVCEAVAYAHRSLVVHRDLKPSNILVSPEGIPKLLDFGVAKLLEPGSDVGFTFANIGPLTPEYASPEQIRGLPITTAADVYSLGAILFELLTGSRAQRIATHSPIELERVVCQTDTPRPSAVARASGAPHRLNRDLDNIVLMAMRKEPERRYVSIDQFADDIRRYLEGRAILARQDSVLYRSGKFIRRNRVVVGAAALVFASLLGGLIVAEKQAHRAEVARQFAETQRAVAERERQTAEAQRKIAQQEEARAESESRVARSEQERSRRRLAEMLQLANSSLFDVHSAIEKLPGATEARRQIVVTTLKYLEKLSRDAEKDDDLQFVLSASYYKVANVLGYPLQPNLGDTQGAAQNYKKSLTLLQPLLRRAPNRPEYALQEVEIKSNWATLLARTGEEPQALNMLQETIPGAQRLPGLCPKEIDCLLAEGQVYSVMVSTLTRNDSRRALNYSLLQTQAIERALKTLPNNQEVLLDLGTAYSQQAQVRNIRGELHEAVEQYKRAVAIRESALEKTPSDVLIHRSLMITYGNLGGTLGSPLYPNLGDTAGAKEYYGRAVAIARQLASADRNDQLAQYDLANALLFRYTLDLAPDEWADSLTNLQEAESILQKLVTSDPRSIPKIRTLATVEEYEGKRQEALGNSGAALAKSRDALAVNEQALERSPGDLGLISQALASEEGIAEILAQRGDQPGALEMAHKAIARAERVPTPESERDRGVLGVALAYQSLATVEAAFANWSEARSAAQRAVDGLRQLQASGSRRADSGKLAKAETLLKDCEAHLR